MNIVLTLLATGVYVLFSLFCFRSGYIFNQHNAVLSCAVSVCFALGVLFAIRLFLRLRHEEAALASLRRLSLESRAHLQQIDVLLPRSWVGEILRSVDKISRAGAPIDYGDLSTAFGPTILDGAATLRYIANAVLLLGLLGTLVGLIQAISGYRAALQGGASLIEDLHAILAGLDKAFGTSISGIAAALVLGFLASLAASSQRRVKKAIDFHFTTEVLPVFAPLSSDLVAAAVEKSLLKTLPGVIREVSDRLVHSSDKLESSMVTALDYAELLRAAASELSGSISSITDQQREFTSALLGLRGDASNLSDLGAEAVQKISRIYMLANDIASAEKAALVIRSATKEEVSATKAEIARLVSSLDTIPEAMKAISKSLSEADFERKRVLHDHSSFSSNVERMVDAIQATLSRSRERDEALLDMVGRSRDVFSAQQDVVRSLGYQLNGFASALAGLRSAIEQIYKESNRSDSARTYPNLLSRLRRWF